MPRMRSTSSHMGYATRALESRDPRFARVFRKLGYARAPEPEAAPPPPPAPPRVDPLDHDRDGRKGGAPKVEPTDDLSALRAEYAELAGKRAFTGWSAETLREKIAALKAA